MNETTEDHRVRVGAQRREKTRQRLLESALPVIVAKGPDDVVIEDFIAAAGVSRGTFYNHFDTAAELMLTLATAMSDEVLDAIDPLVLAIPEPMHRFATGARLYMHVAVRYPVWARFITRVGTRIAARGQQIEANLTRDLEAARADSRIRIDDVLVARDIVLGSIFHGIGTMLTEATHEHHPEHMMFAVLKGFGVQAPTARRIAFAPLPDAGLLAGPIFSRLVRADAGA